MLKTFRNIEVRVISSILVPKSNNSGGLLNADNIPWESIFYSFMDADQATSVHNRATDQQDRTTDVQEWEKIKFI